MTTKWVRVVAVGCSPRGVPTAIYDGASGVGRRMRGEIEVSAAKRDELADALDCNEDGVEVEFLVGADR
jgi:hypothetical protein